MSKKIWIVLLTSVLFLCSCVTVKIEDTIYAMNTFFDITLYQGKNEDLAEIKAIIKKYDQLFDHFRTYDDVINVKSVNDANETIVVGDELLEAIETAKEYHYITGGYFNVAIGKAIDLWKTAFETGILPEEAELLALKTSNDIENIVIEGNQVTLINDAKIDLGGFGKGYVLKLIKEYLDEKEIKKYMINAGMSSILFGRFEDNRSYQLSINHPTDKSYLTTFKIKDKSVGTSGNYTQYILKDERKFHHILNPLTLFPENHYQSLTIVADNPLECDIFSTALFSFDIPEIKEFAKNNPNISFIIYTTDNQLIRIRGEHYEES